MPDETLLLYTRRHLARNHLLAPQPNSQCRLPPLHPVIDIRDPFAFSSFDDLDVRPAPLIHTEKLLLEHDTAIYLSSILSAPDDGEKLLCGDLRWSRTRRIEEPSVKEKRKRRTHSVREDTLQEVPLDMGGDTGIVWDRNTRRQVQEYVRNLEAEKMSIGPEALRFLQDVHRPKTPPSTAEVVLVAVTEEPMPEFMTPPLLPSSPITLPPSLRLAERLDVGPVNAGSTSSLMSDLTASFMAADSMLVDPSPADCTSNFLQHIPPTPSPIRKRPRPETLMVESLLTPPASTTKRVRFASLELPPRISTPELEEAENKSQGQQILVRVERELAQEQLQEADSTLRIEIPVMDFSRPKLPWEGPGNGLERVRDLETWAGLAAKKWGGSGGVGMELSWRPFVRSAIVVAVEELEDAEFMNEFLVRSEDGEENERTFLDSLRALGLKKVEEDNETELEPGVFTVRMDMEALVQRKKKQKRPKLDDHIRAAANKRNGKEASGLQKDAGPLSTNPLDTFMALRSRIAKKSENALNSRTIQINPIAQLNQVPTVLPKPTPSIAPQPFPVPKINLPASPGTFIASTTLLSERRLFRGIKDLYPTATIIERDFTVPIPDTFNDAPHTTDADPEADLLLSPLCGVVLTTLQKIRQAPLPGHAMNSTRQRIADVALLYERLFVLVLGTVRSSDAETIAGFMSFAAALRLSVYVRVVPEEGDAAASWTVALMVREGSQVRLLDEETLWERFLRRAGLNAFAAQVVLRECREVGLRGLLKIEGDGRRRLFVDVAGERVGERVERRLVGVWGE